MGDLALSFGQPTAEVVARADRVRVALPNALIAGAAAETWAHPAGPGRRHGALTLWRCGRELWGAGTVPTGAGGVEAATGVLYRNLFEAMAEAADAPVLHRIWNYIPQINAPWVAGDGAGDTYQAFCRGRALALRNHDGGRMPAASAMGTPGDRLVVVFVAGTDAVRYVENPQQLSAWRYPRRYGPHPPTFARGSLVSRPDGARRLYLSGTAAIRDSDSQHPGDAAAQFEVALDNADLVARSAGLPGGLNRDSPGSRRLRVYLRHAADWDLVRPVLERRLWRDGDWLAVIQADICRPELLAEIEACVDLA